MTTELKIARQLFSDSAELLAKANSTIEDRESGVTTREESESRIYEILVKSNVLWEFSNTMRKQIPSGKQKRLREILVDAMRNCSIISDYGKHLINYNCQKIVDEVISKYGSIEEAAKQGFQL